MPTRVNPKEFIHGLKLSSQVFLCGVLYAWSKARPRKRGCTLIQAHAEYTRRYTDSHSLIALENIKPAVEKLEAAYQARQLTAKDIDEFGDWLDEHTDKILELELASAREKEDEVVPPVEAMEWVNELTPDQKEELSLVFYFFLGERSRGHYSYRLKDALRTHDAKGPKASKEVANLIDRLEEECLTVEQIDWIDDQIS